MNNQLFIALEAKKAKVKDSLRRVMNDEEFYLEELRKLPNNQNIINLRKAVEQKDYLAAKNEAHTLKGVALNLGLVPLADICMDMLLDFKDGKNEDAFEQLEDVEVCFHEWVKIIEENTPETVHIGYYIDTKEK